MEGKKGAPRRSHKKSRNGCKTCVRRHIRCDETRPRCHNCTYRSLPCHYARTSPQSSPDSSPHPDSPCESSASTPTTIALREQSSVRQYTISFLNESSSSHVVDLDIGTSRGTISQLYHHTGESKLRGSDVYRSPEIGSLEPFDALPIKANSHVHSLLSHLDKIVRHSRGLPGPRERWLSFAVSDSAVLRMLLFIAALDIAGLRGKSDSPDIIYWKGETIRTINDRLGDSKEMATDGTIAAVASLAHLENLAGTAESARIHATGLEALVKSRGGLQNLGAHDMTRRIVSWSDICTSIILERKPRYDPIFFKEEISVANRSPPSILAHHYQTKLFELTGMYDLSDELVTLHEELRTLSYLKEKAAYSLAEGEEIDNVPFTDTADHLERRLVPLTQLGPFLNQTQVCSIFVLFGYAALIHLYLFIRDCSKDLPFSHLLSHRMRTVLAMVDTQQLETQLPELMLWIYIMGGLSGSPSLERAWFAKRAAHFCRKSGLRGGEQIKDLLVDFLWSDLYRSPVTERFWFEVAKAQGSIVGYEVHRMADRVSLVYFNAPADFDHSI